MPSVSPDRVTAFFKRERSFATERPVGILMIFIAAVVFGWFSLKRLPVALMPALTYPTLTVRTEYPGSAPEEVENDISRPIEEALGVVSGLNKISSVSRAGISDVTLEFNWGTDMRDAIQDTLEKLDLIFLPRDAERPLILHFDPSLDPIMELSLAGEGARFDGEEGLRALRRIADLQIKRVLEPIKGVAAVRIRGGLEEEIHVLLDEEELKRTGLSIQDISGRLGQENINVAGGTLVEGRAEYMVRTINEFENIKEIEDVIVRRIEERDIRVKDLAEIKRAHREREILTRTDGYESVQIDIYKEADANMVSVAKTVTDAIMGIPEAKSFGPPKPQGNNRNEGIAKRLKREEDITLKIAADRSGFIEDSINEVKNTAIFGGMLAVGILYLFLRNLKTTVIIGLSIPMSLVITFAPLNLMGVSLNIMSLGGLAMGIGMLVDSSIVVLESIFRCREEGDGIVKAAVRGTREVRGAVFSSTLTSIAVFFPMVFVEGIAGQAFSDLGIAVVISLLASLAVALYFIPMLSSRQKPELNKASEKQGFKLKSWSDFRQTLSSLPKILVVILFPLLLIKMVVGCLLEIVGLIITGGITLIAHLVRKILVPALVLIGKTVVWLPLKIAGWVLDLLKKIYPPVIKWSLNNLIIMILLTAASFWATWNFSSRLTTELLPEVHQGEFTVEVSLPVGTPLEETVRQLEGIEKALQARVTNAKDDNSFPIRSILTTYGFDVSNIKRSDEGEHSSRFRVLLKDTTDAVASEEKALSILRPLFEDAPDANFRVVRPVLFSAQTPIVVEVHGDELPELKAIADQCASVMGTLTEVTDVETTLKRGAPEVQIVYDRDQIVRFGLNLQQVAGQVRDLVRGNEATRFNMKDRRIPIVAKLQEFDRERVEDISEIIINPAGEHPIPLSSVAKIELGEGPSEIRRIDGKRVALVQANIAQGASLGTAVTAIESALRDQIEWPRGNTFFITGQNEEWEKGKSSLYLALGLSLFLVYAIMAAQFESLIQPLIIMFTVPLAFFGAAAALMQLEISLSIVVALGLIMLAGIVVNNAIVLIDYANILRSRGIGLKQAVIQAGEVRLRPILITTSTTVLGLLPMAMGLGDGAEIRTPMAITVIFGLISSTFLTLLIIPSLYFMVEALRERFLGKIS